MKPLLNLLELTLFILIIVTFQSCKKDLTREEAKVLIVEKYNLPRVTNREYTLSTEREYDLTSTTKDVSDYTPPKLDFLIKLEDAGLASYSISLLSSNVYDETWYSESGSGYSSPLDYFTGKDAGRTHKYNIKATYLHSCVLTEKGKQDFDGGNSFKVTRTDFGEITGIVKSEGLNVTEVEYTLVETPTNFGMSIFDMQNKVFKQTATFRKYDDGWRIE